MLKYRYFFIFLCFVFIVITTERVKAEDAVGIVVNFENSFLVENNNFIVQCESQQDCMIKSVFVFKKSPENTVLRVFKSAVNQSVLQAYKNIKWWNDFKLSAVKMTEDKNDSIKVEIFGQGGKSSKANYILKQNINQFGTVSEEFFSLMIMNVYLNLNESLDFTIRIQELEFDFNEGKIKSKVGISEKLEYNSDILM